MTMLTWNSNAGNYQATVGNDLVEVDGDVYSETVADLTGTYIEEGMIEFAARNRAEAELGQAEAWMSSPMDGVSINGVPQE